MISRIVGRYRACAARQGYVAALVFSIVAFLGALAVNSYAIAFATDHASNGVTDLILSNIPVVDVDGVFVYSTFLAIGVTALILLSQPRRLPFALNALALFLLIRSGFTSLTHIGPFAPLTVDFGQTITRSFFGADFFFSGHTGMPFLAALSFWRDRALRYFYLGLSLCFAAIVLLGHLHYSIDVFSAFFITYTIFDLAKWLFPRDFALFSEKIS